MLMRRRPPLAVCEVSCLERAPWRRRLLALRRSVGKNEQTQNYWITHRTKHAHNLQIGTSGKLLLHVLSFAYWNVVGCNILWCNNTHLSHVQYFFCLKIVRKPLQWQVSHFAFEPEHFVPVKSILSLNVEEKGIRFSLMFFLWGNVNVTYGRSLQAHSPARVHRMKGYEELRNKTTHTNNERN